MKRIGVLWDMDGVLVDTEEFHYQAWTEAFRRYQLPFDDGFFRKTFGMNNRGLLTEALGRPPEPGLLAEIGAFKEKSYRHSIRGNVQPLPGVRTLLQDCAHHGALQAIASSGPRPNIELIVNELNIGPFFQAVVSGADLPGKPDPAVFLEAAGRLGIDPGDCLVIEDSVVGVKAAKSAGMTCLAVINTHPASSLRGADLVVESLEQCRFESLYRLLAGQAPA